MRNAILIAAALLVIASASAYASLTLTGAGGAAGAVVSGCGALQLDYSLATGCNAVGVPATL